ncbi:hypothetical protein F4801DRAFT_563251 [Xylaria longipes]|nr:hypothetical protein F4801DRAFT_563251 [Xylaria longipes]
MEGIPLTETHDASLIIRQFLSEAPQNNQKPDERTLTARPCSENLELFRELLKVSTNEHYPISKSDLVSLERSFGRLKLWSDGYGVAAGRLDEVFSRSQMLRSAALELLGSLATTLTERLVPRLTNSWSAQEPLNTFILEVKSLVERIDAEDDEGSSSDESYDFESDSINEIAQDLFTDTLCLMELDPLLKSPIMDERDDEEIAAAHNDMTNWAPHYVYCERVRSRFPQAPNPLIFRLGKANFERYIRCQEERDSRDDSTPDVVANASSMLPKTDSVDGSQFYDSALGSSASYYAETIKTYGGKEGRSVRVPPLPHEGKTRRPFPCVACGRSVRISNNSVWKQHLYADLCPWLCLDPSCSRGDKVYKKKTDWISHLALDHHLGPAWESMECPLCFQNTGVGKVEIEKHLGSHLEEISLGALPSGLESDTESEDEDQDAEDYQSDSSWKLGPNSDFTDMPVDSNTLTTREAEAHPMNSYNHRKIPFVKPADQNPPCNTLYIGNLPIDTSEEELKAMFQKQRGYKRLCFRTKQSGPMCFVEFDDITQATRALYECHGKPLSNSVGDGIHISFSKNPLGVRSSQPAESPGK